jgi:hypothetical protein
MLILKQRVMFLFSHLVMVQKPGFTGMTPAQEVILTLLLSMELFMNGLSLKTNTILSLNTHQAVVSTRMALSMNQPLILKHQAGLG